ncbi:uncharacterized protein LOC112539890 [Tetranychus urticae]|uniref:Uncharacterized protein n=1 Tax=Tetranychus urticae TaxID=32264 RepID=T1JVL6_TETUR|nr:uncharacterized protein LOC112539890 [Tetranychus urticae]
MRPRKFVAKGSRHPKIHIDHNVPLKVALAFIFLGAAVVILTISLVALIVSVKARFEGLTATINSLTMKEEFDREHQKFVVSRRELEKEFVIQTDRLNKKEKAGNDRLTDLKDLLSKLGEFEADLQKIALNLSLKYSDQSANSHKLVKENCDKLKKKLVPVQKETAELKNKMDNLQKSLQEADMKIATSSWQNSLKESFPKNFKYYQLGGYPAPNLLWSFLDWSVDLPSNRMFIKISDDESQFGQSYTGQTLLESAFELEFTPNPVANNEYFLKFNPNITGTLNLTHDFSEIDPLVPKSRRITIWKLQN